MCICVCVVLCDGTKWGVFLISHLSHWGPQLESLLSQPNILFIPSPNYWRDFTHVTFCKWDRSLLFLSGSRSVHALRGPSSPQGKERLRPRGTGSIPGSWACPKESPHPDYVPRVPRQIGCIFSWPDLLYGTQVWEATISGLYVQTGVSSLRAEGPVANSSKLRPSMRPLNIPHNSAPSHTFLLIPPAGEMSSVL